MNQLNPRNLRNSEVMKLAEQGQEFICPICSTLLETNPPSWQPGQKLHGLACPNSQHHFLVYGDEAESLDLFCTWIESIQQLNYCSQS